MTILLPVSRIYLLLLLSSSCHWYLSSSVIHVDVVASLWRSLCTYSVCQKVTPFWYSSPSVVRRIT